MTGQPLDPAAIDYTREVLIGICERAAVPVADWCNRDTPRSQTRLGEVWALLKAGCDFEVLYESNGLCTNADTVWVEVTYPGFAYFDWDGEPEVEHFYLPTAARLDAVAGKDWY